MRPAWTSDIADVALVGVGATLLMDIWIYALHRVFRLPMTDWGLAGRWFWNLRIGRVMHDDIALAPPFGYERAFGWCCHYAIGVVYAGLLLVISPGWLHAPTYGVAWTFGMITILPGWLLMQPGMGAGVAASRRANRVQIRCLNIVSHTVFAVGLYGTARLIR